MKRGAETQGRNTGTDRERVAPRAADPAGVTETRGLAPRRLGGRRGWRALAGVVAVVAVVRWRRGCDSSNGSDDGGGMAVRIAGGISRGSELLPFKKAEHILDGEDKSSTHLRIGVHGRTADEELAGKMPPWTGIADEEPLSSGYKEASQWSCCLDECPQRDRRTDH
eukprot:6201280-Pleurochrysis_carterae.AAC.19